MLDILIPLCIFTPFAAILYRLLRELER